jgi:APA family basic amino acid/polyamine antiporter
VALGIAVPVYLVVGVAALLAAGPDRLARSAAPLAEALRVAWAARLVPVAAVGATLASLGALLAMIAGIGRTTLAMARHRDLPAWLAAVHPRYRVPYHAELALGAAVCVLAAAVDLRELIGFSSFGVLIYYAIANAAAYTQPRSQRRWPRVFNVCGVTGCLLLVFALPPAAVVAGLGMFATGLAGRAVVLRWRA